MKAWRLPKIGRNPWIFLLISMSYAANSGAQTPDRIDHKKYYGLYLNEKAEADTARAEAGRKKAHFEAKLKTERELHAERDGHEDAIKRFRADIDKLTDAIKGHEQVIADRKAEVERHRATITRLEAENTRLAADETQLDKDIDRQSDVVDRRQGERDQAERALADARASLTRAEQQLASLEGQRADVVSAVSALEGEIGGVETDLANMENERRRNVTRLTELGTTIATLEADAQAARQANQDLQVRLGEVKQRQDHLSELDRSLRRDRDRLAEQLTRLQTARDEAERKLERARATAKREAEREQSIQQSIAQKIGAATQKNTEASRLEESVGHMTEALKQTRTHLTKAEDDQRAVSTELQTLEADINRVSGEVAATQQELTKLRAEHQGQLGPLEALKARLVEAQKAEQQALAALTAHQAAIAQARARISQLDDAARHAQAVVQAKQGQLAQANAQRMACPVRIELAPHGEVDGQAAFLVDLTTGAFQLVPVHQPVARLHFKITLKNGQVVPFEYAARNGTHGQFPNWCPVSPAGSNVQAAFAGRPEGRGAAQVHPMARDGRHGFGWDDTHQGGIAHVSLTWQLTSNFEAAAQAIEAELPGLMASQQTTAQQLATERTTLQSLEQQLTGLQTRYDASKRTAAEQAAELTRLGESLGGPVVRIAELERKLATAQGELATMGTRRDAGKRHFDEIGKTIAQVKNEITKKEGEIATAQANAASLRSAANALTAEAAGLEKDQRDAAARVDEARAAAKQAEVAMGQADAELNERRAGQNEIDARLAMIRTEAEQTRQWLDVLAREIQNSQRSAAGLDQQVVAAKDEQVRLKDRNDAIAIDTQTKRGLIELKRQAIANEQRTIKRLDADISRADASRQDAARIQSERASDFAQKRDAHQASVNDLDDLRRRQKAVRDQIAANRTEADRLEQRIGAAGEESEEAGRQITEAEQRQDGLQGEIVATEDKIKALAPAITVAEKETVAAREEMDRFDAVAVKEEGERDAAYKKYEDVMARYKTELDQAVASGKADAKAPGAREADEKAKVAAEGEAERLGTVEGQNAGRAAGEQRDYLKGTTEGLAAGQSKGHDEGWAAGADEGRASGEAAGDVAGRKAGYDEGYDAGYREAFKKARTEADNEEHYREGYDRGYTVGVSRAEETAKNEDYPRGRQAAEQELTDPTSKPLNEVVIDQAAKGDDDSIAALSRDWSGMMAMMTIGLTTIEGRGDGACLNRQVPDVTLPAVAFEHRDYQREFDYEPYAEAYRKAYDETYQSSFATAYRATYGATFSANYQSHCETAYATAFAVSYDERYQAGHADGEKRGYQTAYQSAREEASKEDGEAYRAGYQTGYDAGHEAQFQPGYAQGALSGAKVGTEKGTQDAIARGSKSGEEAGYADTIDEARETMFAKGKQDFTDELQRRGLATFVGGQLKDQDGDGLLRAGEAFSVSLDLRNFGGLAVAEGDLTVTVEQSASVRDLTSTNVVLKSLAGQTLAHYQNVVKGVALSAAGGGQVSLTLAVLHRGTKIGGIKLEQPVRESFKVVSLTTTLRSLPSNYGPQDFNRNVVGIQNLTGRNLQNVYVTVTFRDQYAKVFSVHGTWVKAASFPAGQTINFPFHLFHSGKPPKGAYTVDVHVAEGPNVIFKAGYKAQVEPYNQ